MNLNPAALSAVSPMQRLGLAADGEPMADWEHSLHQLVFFYPSVYYYGTP